MKRITQHLCLLFTRSLCAGDPLETLRAALRGGVDLVQWREPAADRAAALACRRVCDTFAVPLIVNDHVDLAVAIDAAGAHVGQTDLAAAAARRALGADRLLGVSTHDAEQICAASAAGADYVGFGPIFATVTKGYREGLPAGALQRAVELATVPVFAIGGITIDNLGSVVAAGARRVAVSAAILAAADPLAVATTMASTLAAARLEGR